MVTTGPASLPSDAGGADTSSYVGLAAEYDALLGPLARDTWRRGVIRDVATLGFDAGAAVVDLGAGTGIGGQLLPEVIPGAHRTGVDRSSMMLAQSVGSYERTCVGELVDLPVRSGSVDLMISGFDTLNYLNADDLARCFGEVRRCLVPGGWLVFDYSSPQLVRRHWRDRSEDQPLADGMLRWRHRYQPETDHCVSTLQRLDATGAVRWHETHIQFAVDTDRMQQIAAQTGLVIERVRDLLREEFSPASHTHVWTLRKEL